MPVQNNASLQIINQNNIGFGTIRLQQEAYASNYRYNLNFAAGQLPSIYLGQDPAISNDTVRLRPLHAHGFLATTGATRLYFAVAGLPMENPHNALTTRLEHVVGPIYKSRYYVFVRLGVTRSDFNQVITDLINDSRHMTTAQLQAANAAKNVREPTHTVYVNQGDLSGTFWGFKHAGWEHSFFGSNVNNLYRPLNLMDFPIQGGEVGTAQGIGNQYRASLDLIPRDRRRVHSGHSLIDGNGLQAYYAAQPDPSGVNVITGQQLWDRLFRLGQYRQFFGAETNGVQIQQREILPGGQVFPQSLFRYFPTYNNNRPVPQILARQREYICRLIAGFVNN